jgi:hypothetical protein
MMIRSYKELVKLDNYEDRYLYLLLGDKIGEDTFGFDRYLNQTFYKSSEWKRLRNEIIIRDNGCDLGMSGFDIYGKIIIHHMNPIRKNDILNATDYLMNPDFLICVSMDTHNAIHYGDKNYLDRFKDVSRSPNDICPWRRN